MSGLREPFATLERDIMNTLRGGETSSVPDYHALCRGIESLMRKYDMKLRPSPLSQSDIDELPPTCPVCRKPLGSHVATLQRFDETKQTYAHPECINYPTRTP